MADSGCRDGKRPLAKQSLEKTLFFLCKRFSISNLRKKQLDCIHQFLSRRDVFVNKPTESGKSISFQMAPFAEMALANMGTAREKRKTILIVI